MMSHHKNNLRILYLNSHGICDKIHEIYAFMTHREVDITCINETFLKPHIHIPSHPNFVTHRLDREETDLGGLLILVNKTIPHKVIPVVPCKLIENIGIEVTTSRDKIKFLSCYLPGGIRYASLQQHYKNNLRLLTNQRNRYYCIGDFNSKHRFWNCASNNTAGVILYNELMNGIFDIIYPDEHTHHPFDVNRASSTIDIGLTHCDFNLSNISQHHFRSDRNGIMFDVLINSDIELNSLSQKRPSFKHANWRLS